MEIIDEYKTAIIGIKDYEFFRVIDDWLANSAGRWVISTHDAYDKLVPYLAEKGHVFNMPNITDYTYVTFKRIR